MTYFDTDVVIHSIIVQDQLKHNQAIDLIRQAIENEAFFISFLVLHETAFVLSKLRFSSEFISENIKSFSTFASFHYSESIFSRARLLAEKIGFQNINDCVHTAIAEALCSEIVSFNKKDFDRIKSHTDLKVSVL